LKTVFIAIDHGIGLAYFLNTDLISLLLKGDVRVVLLVQDELIQPLREQFAGQPNLAVESLRLKAAANYQETYHGGVQVMMDYVRRTSANHTIPLTYVDTHRQRKEYEAENLKRKLSLVSMRPLIWLLRHSKAARQQYRRALQSWFTPHIYDDLLDQYHPDLVVSDTAGWRLDQYLLREAHRRGIRTATVIIGWDNPSSQGLPGAFVDDVVVWSDIHKWEMTAGVDWPAEHVLVGGMPLYDGYISGKWQMTREEYFKFHHLDLHKRLISFAATALSISPNLHIIELLAEIIASQALSQPSQLLIRLHPNHFKSQENYRQEREAIMKLVANAKDVHVVEPMEVPGGLERYSGEDYVEKASMLAHSDVLVTVYSTMVVESALHDTPFISVCIDSPTGWDHKFWIPLSTVPGWPTARRVVKAHAGKTVFDRTGLIEAIDAYLSDPDLEKAERHQFVEQELTYLNGESTQVTARMLLSLLDKGRQA
jgi:hypothetical protein